MADDAGALLVRSGLVTSSALDDARARVVSGGGTLGEQLVTAGAIGDDDLTDFYRARLLVPQVNPNALARLTPKLVATIPSDMAIELRAIPVSLDGDNNLTVAMSDPSDRHAVDEIAFFTGSYVVRAVATQMQIAWCLAHYYGHVTVLGQRLLFEDAKDSPARSANAAAARLPRAKGLTGRVNASRHRAVAPVTGPVDVVRPNGSELDHRTAPPGATPGAEGAAGATVTPPRPIPVPAAVAASTSAPTLARASSGTPPPGARAASVGSPAPAVARATSPTSQTLVGPPPAARPAQPSADGAAFASAVGASISTSAGAARPASSAMVRPSPLAAQPAAAPVRAAPSSAVSHGHPVYDAGNEDSARLPAVDLEDDTTPTEIASYPGIVDNLHSVESVLAKRTRSVSGEIRSPVRRAASIKPLPLPEPEPDDDNDDPVIVIESGPPDDTEVRKPAPRRRIVKSDPPELYARAGEVDLKSGADRAIDADEPRIVVDEDALAPSTQLDIQIVGDSDAVIHDRLADRDSQPILLDRPRSTPQAFASADEVGEDTYDDDVVVLDARKQRPRLERRTQVGAAPAPAVRPPRDTDPSQPAPGALRLDDATTVEARPAPPGDDTASDVLAPPPFLGSEDDTNPYIIAPPPAPTPPRAPIRPALLIDDEDDSDEDDEVDDDPVEPRGPRTSVMSTVELDAAVPERKAEVVPGHLARHRIDYDAVDDGWGPPGTTIPPPLLGAIPGSEDDDATSTSAIPIQSADSTPLMVGPAIASAAADTDGRALVRALEDSTARAIDVIRQLEHAQTRDQVVDIMVGHLAQAHRRAGFFVTRHAGPTELSLFSMMPRPAVLPFAVLRLDRPSTLQDVVGTRLPYRGPMHDEASRMFLDAILGACPPEILLVPVAVRERVVGVLFGEHRHRHTFDDQLALAARAAGMALERILKAKRSS